MRFADSLALCLWDLRSIPSRMAVHDPVGRGSILEGKDGLVFMGVVGGDSLGRTRMEQVWSGGRLKF
jgi:hypothetical protein